MAGTNESRFGFDDDANGFTATLVGCNNPDGNSGAFFTQVGIARWVERDAGGAITCHFEERNRDAWSIYLHDSSRGVDLQLDLHRKMVGYADAERRFDLYPITSALRRASGWTLHSVDAASLAGSPTVSFRQTGATRWCEFDTDGRPRFRFDEVQRDDWSVYLTDPSRNVALQLDVHRNVVGYSDDGPTQDLYVIAGSDVPGRHQISPEPTGRTINRADFASGSFVQTGPLNWVETGADGAVRYHFMETARDRRAVHLSDVARGVTIQLHVQDRTVTYADASQHRFVLYEISDVASKVNGRTVNRVTFANADGHLLGALRQTGDRTWVELDKDLQTAYRFVETGRDDWSVYLHDASRDVHLAVDLHTRNIGYRDRSQSVDLYAVEAASADHGHLEPLSPLPVKGHNVRTVHIGGMDGAPLGRLRQVDESRWLELDAQGEARFEFEATQRTNESLHLHDRSRDVTLTVDLTTQRIHYRDPNNSFLLYTVLRASAVRHGWLASEIEFGLAADMKLGFFRRTEDGQWTEFDSDNNARFHFTELALEDWMIRLHDPNRNVAIDLDLRLQQVLYGGGPTTTRTQYLILDERIESGIWLHSEKITSRSSLTHDFDPDGTDLNERPVYRTSISFTAATRWVDIWASKEVTITVDETPHTVSPVSAARVRIPTLAKISVSIPALDLDCPTLTLRTDLMMPDQRHPIHPDVEAHKKIVSLPAGALATHRQRLGVSETFTDEDLAHVQRAMINVARTKQYTYNRRSHGVHHDRVLHPANMEHPHFTVDFSDGRPRYTPLRPHEVAAHTAGAKLVSADVGQDFLGIGHFFKKATKVVVHTVKAVGHDIEKTAEHIVKDVVQTAENIGHDVIHTVDEVGEDLIHGDILKAGQDLWQGGEHLGSDLTKGVVQVGSDVASGAASVLGDVASGAGQLVVITLHAAEEAVKFVLTHTGAVGRLVQSLFDKIGAAIDKVIGWLLDALGWGDIVRTHDALISLFNRRIDELAAQPLRLKETADTFFANLSDTVSADLERAIREFQPAAVDTHQPSPGGHHSGAVEKIEWFMSKFMLHSPAAPALASPFSSPAHASAHDSLMDDVVRVIEDKLGRDGAKIRGAIENAVGSLGAISSDPSHTPEYLIVALLELVEAVAVLAIDAVSAVIDIVLDAVAALITGMKDVLNSSWDIPFIGDLYRTATQGRELTMLGAVSLLAAIPLTSIYKSKFHEAPFATTAVAADLVELTADQKAIGAMYGVTHLILGPLAIVQDVRTGMQAGTDGVNNTLKGVGKDVESGLDPKTGHFLTVMDWAFNAHTMFTGFPTQLDDPYIIPLSHGRADVFERPSYFAHITYWYLLGGFCINTFLSVGDALSEGRPNLWVGRVSTVFNTAFGLALMGLMATIDVADRSKTKALATIDPGGVNHGLHGQELFTALEDLARAKHEHVPYWSFDTNGDVVRGRDKRHITVSDWEDSMRNFREWGRSGAGIRRKGFGNVMDSFPAIGQLFAEPDFAEDTLGISLIVTGVFDILGHWGEGITTIDRTVRNELV